MNCSEENQRTEVSEENQMMDVSEENLRMDSGEKIKERILARKSRNVF